MRPEADSQYVSPGRTVLKYLGLTTLIAMVACLVGCIEVSEGTWLFGSADTPKEWPAPTPVGQVRVKTYPVHRVAEVRDADLAGQGMEPMFLELFEHIKSNDIAMTAPVEMGYTNESGSLRMNSMAFLYRSPDLGTAGEQGTVKVADRADQTFASVGIRGDYTTANFQRGLDLLAPWLEQNRAAWMLAGPPRYLGYNGPFVPSFMRYGEVQIPLRRLETN